MLLILLPSIFSADALLPITADNRKGVLQNHPDGAPADDTSVILPLEPTGPYHAIGIRMSFGLAMDPVTGYMWDTEDGGDSYDEINLLTPNFNSGWDVIMGPTNSSHLSSLPHYDGYNYYDPKFSLGRTNWSNCFTIYSVKSF